MGWVKKRKSEPDEAKLRRPTAVWFSVISGCFLGSKRGRLRAHALRRVRLSASVPTLTRRLLGLTFTYYPTPRAWGFESHCVRFLRPHRALAHARLPWAIVLSPRKAGLVISPMWAVIFGRCPSDLVLASPARLYRRCCRSGGGKKAPQRGAKV